MIQFKYLIDEVFFMTIKNNKIILNLIFVILIIVLCFLVTPVSFQNDTFYSIKIGETISNNGIDMQDHYSWHENLAYTYPHWLFDFITYKFYALKGFFGVYLMTCIFASLLGLTLFFVNKKLCKNDLVSFLITIFIIFLIEPFIAARSQIITYTLFLLTIYFIEKFIQNKKVYYAIALFIISVLIANVHIAVWPFFFVLFLPHIAEEILFLIGEHNVNSMSEINTYKKELKQLKKENKELDKIKKYEEKIIELENEKEKKIKERNEKISNPYKILMQDNKNVKWLVLIMIVCLLSAFITPLGAKTVFTYLANTISGDTMHYISEHQPTIIISCINLLIMLVAFISLLTFSKTKIRLSDLFLFSGLTLLALYSNRHIALLLILGSYIINTLLSKVTNVTEEKTQEVAQALISHPIMLIYMSLFTIGLGFSVLQTHFPLQFVKNELYPVEATNYIKNNIDTTNMRLFNEYNYGSYLLFNDIPVFIDSRADLYTCEFNPNCTVFDDSTKIESGKVYCEEIFEKYNITHILIPKNEPLYNYISNSGTNIFEELYSDDNFAFFQRNSTTN